MVIKCMQFKGGIEMKLRELLDMYDNWNGITVINDDNLEPIIKDKTSAIVENERFLDCEVVAFKFYENEFCVRIRKEELK